MIIHVLQDGRRLDDLKGYVVRKNDKTIEAYHLLTREWET